MFSETYVNGLNSTIDRLKSDLAASEERCNAIMGAHAKAREEVNGILLEIFPDTDDRNNPVALGTYFAFATLSKQLRAVANFDVMSPDLDAEHRLLAAKFKAAVIAHKTDQP